VCVDIPVCGDVASVFALMTDWQGGVG